MTELLLSLPPNMYRQLLDCYPHIAKRCFATHDPEKAQLGSGGGTAGVLQQAWQSLASGGSFADWINDQRKIVIHGGGESRRLPAYAASGKLFMPVPVMRWSRGQQLGQTLLELHEPFMHEVLNKAHDNSRVMIASGDVLLRSSDPIPKLPDADVVLLGMWTSADIAQNYGVLFCDRNQPDRLTAFRQKPSPDEILERSRDALFMVDVGVWLLSAKAVECLMAKCGWQKDKFQNEIPDNYDLYGKWATHLGEDPESVDKEVSQLSVAVVPIHGGEFYHFGTTGDVLEATYTLQNIVKNQTKLGAVPSLSQPKQFIQDALVRVPVRRQDNDSLWIDQSYVPETWRLKRRHMLTGVPKNDWELNLSDGVCMDFVPVGDSEYAIRPYGFNDRFRGPVSDEATLWLEAPVKEWFDRRGIDFGSAKIAPDTDLQSAELFPVLEQSQLTADFVQWLIDGTPSAAESKTHASQWLSARRVSAREISQIANLARVSGQRSELRKLTLPLMARNALHSVFYNLDLMDVATQYAQSKEPLPEEVDTALDPITTIHERMFRSEVLRRRDDESWKKFEEAAFNRLGEVIVSGYKTEPLVPENQLAPDQIVWARSPARIDLAGGWTDTPPYCIENGGSVVNIALNLNGQPPIQAFVRRSEEKTITIRSIDLGISETLTTYDEVGSYRKIGSGFSVAKAALALCGFHPEFNGGPFASLSDQLESFGGGVDLSMLAAIPKGSGLGTSSILSGTVLGALNDCCGFGWDQHEIAARVSAVEQMLGSGGGWQDQFGGLLPGAKLVETKPGFDQVAAVRWLPNGFFDSPEVASRSLLYYTGITRVAHDVLQEIVRGMFLNDPARLKVLDAIGKNSRACFDAIQRFDVSAYAESVAQSWDLNQALDSGTNPPAVAELVDRISPYASGLKLAGAGGGGFIYIVAKDAEHARKLQNDLEDSPPNKNARFVAMSVSQTGMQVTRS